MSDAPLALYIHIPFCRTRCRYCDFNTYAGSQGLVPAYCGALAQEARFWAAALGTPEVATIYFGGGTPSLLPVPEVQGLLGAVRDAFPVAPATEISLEANPGTVDEGYLAGLRAVGVNRLSLGVQSFQGRFLRLLGRGHSAAQAREAVAAARRAGGDNLGLDLIYGLPGQSLGDWRADLGAVLALGPEHLSLYALEVAEGTPLAADLAQGRLPAPDPDLAADMYLLAEESLAQAGYLHYELSNWARPGRECRHNLAYWRNGPYLGLGAGAHSWLGGMRFANVSRPEDYIRLAHALAEARPARPGAMAALLAVAPWVAERETISARLELVETVMMGLRLVAGLGLEAFRERFGVGVAAAFPGAVEELGAQGLLETAQGHLRLTPRGRLLGNQVFSRLLSSGL